MDNQEEPAFLKELKIHYDDLSRGIRPKDMDYNTFRLYRTLIQSMQKQRLKGQIIHVSKIYGQLFPGITYRKEK